MKADRTGAEAGGHVQEVVGSNAINPGHAAELGAALGMGWVMAPARRLNKWTRGLATTMLTEALQSVDLFAHLKKRRTYPGIFPLLHLDHIYYEGARVEVRHVELPRNRRTLIASDHLPLVADIRIRF